MRFFALSTICLLLAGVTSAIPTLQVFKREISNRPLGAKCGGTDFNDFQMEDAAKRGVANRNGPNPGGYPKNFGNTEGFKFSNCDGQLKEFPILKSGKVYGGGNPEAFRVIYQLTNDNNAKYCGIVYHPSKEDGRFKHCEDVKK